MMRNWRLAGSLFGILAAMPGGVVGPVQAQVEQTADGAQQFVLQTLDRSLSKFAIKTKSNNYWRTAEVAYLAKLERCRSQLNYRYPDAPTPEWNGSIDWSALGEVEIVPGASANNAVRFVFKEQEYRFEFISSDMATRFAYAATFLRDACDPTAQTGF